MLGRTGKGELTALGDTAAKVAEWYELIEVQVQQAVDFTVVHNLAA